MQEPKFAVIGAGAGGLAMAGHLALQGYDVRLYNRSAERIAPIKKSGGIKLSGVIEGVGCITEITTSIERVVPNADVIMVVVPAYAHREVALSCAPYLRDDQIVLLTPGRTGGAIEFANTLRESNGERKPVIAEAQTILHTCRASGKGAEVILYAIKKHVAVAAFPASKTGEVIQILKPIFPQFEAAEDVLVTSLGNVGAILHPTATLLNIGWIETLRTRFLHYYEGITPSIATFLESLDKERIEVAEALGVKIPSVQEWLRKTYDTNGVTLYETIRNNESYREIYAPQTINHRYIYEDIPTGLVPISSLGGLVGVKTLNVNLIINLASKICKVDFRKSGRTVEALGLAGLNRVSIQKLVKRGNTTRNSNCEYRKG